MSEKAKEDEILKLIRLVDRNKPILFRNFDLFRGEWIFSFVAIVVFFALIWVFLAFAPSLYERIVVATSFVAFMVAYLSLIGRFGEENIVNVNFKRLERCVEEDKKPLLKALIKMKAKHPKFDLEQIYKLNKSKSMFAKEKLLERLYE